MFLEEFFGHIQALNYPAEKLDVYISCQSQTRLEFVQNIVKSWIKDNIYHSVTLENEYKGKPKHFSLLNLKTKFVKFLLYVLVQRIEPLVRKIKINIKQTATLGKS